MRLSTAFLAVFAAIFVAGCVGFTSGIPQNDRRLRIPVEIQEERGPGETVGKVVNGVKEAAKLSDDEAVKIMKILTNSEKARKGLQVGDDEIARLATMIRKTDDDLPDSEVTDLARVLAAAQKSAKMNDDQVNKIVKIWVDSKRLRLMELKASNDDVAKVSNMFKTANTGATGAAKYSDDEVAKLSLALAEAQKGAGLTEKQVAKVVKLLDEAKRVKAPSNPEIAKLAKEPHIAKVAQELAPVAAKYKKSWSTMKKVIVAALGVTAAAAIIYAVAKSNSS